MNDKKKHNETELERAWSVASHDLKTPLVVIRGNAKNVDQNFLSLLIDVYKKAKAAGLDVPLIRNDQFESYQKALHSTQFLSERLLQYASRLDRKLCPHYFHASTKPIKIAECVKTAIDEYRPRYDLNDKSRIQVDIEDATILGNEEVIEYIVYELLANADAYADSDIKVTITSEKNAKHYTLRIKNTDSNIPEADLPKLFDQHFSTNKSSLGLGLYFCKQAMRDMKGDIICNASNGKSVEFVLTFPVESAG